MMNLIQLGTSGFDWDEGNINKNQLKHAVSTEEIEAFFAQDLAISPDGKHSQNELRYLAVGRTKNGRGMMVSFTIRRLGKARLIRPISARYMHPKEARFHGLA